MPTFLNIQENNSIVTLTMNEPDTRNALTGNTAADEFVAACDHIDSDKHIKAVIITGNGPVFSAGGNLKDMKKMLNEDLPSEAIRESYRKGIQRIPLALYNLEIPTIAAVNGPAIGAGCDLACMCDIRIASKKASFAESFVKVGIIPGDGGAWVLPRVVGMSKAAEMSFTGDRIDAEEALRATNNKFIKRFQHIEAEVSKRGKTPKETPLEELEQYWQDAKSYKPNN